MAGGRINRSTVRAKLAYYIAAQERLHISRTNLRTAVLDWKAKGATIVEIAETLGWSRQSVYDLIRDSSGSRQ